MTQKLSKEIANALHVAGNDGLQVVDPETNRIYFIVDEETHRRAMVASRAEHDHDAIAQGVKQMESGQGKPVAQVFDELRSRMGIPEEA